MKTVETDIDISAPVEDVWHVLTHDLVRRPQDFGITRLDGTLEKGSSLKLWSEVAPERAFKLRVTELSAPHTMVWRGGMPLGLFTGERSFRITHIGDKSRFHMTEVFSGPLSGPITRAMPDLRPSFQKFAQALKKKAEAR